MDRDGYGYTHGDSAPDEETLRKRERERERNRQRSKRKRLVRAKSWGQTSRVSVAAGRLEYPEMPGVDYERPATRGDCARLRGVDDEGKPNPCPFVSCKWHLYLDVNEANGSLKVNFPDIEPHELVETCALDVADRGEQWLETVGDAMNITRECVRKIENKMLAALRTHRPWAAEHLRDGTPLAKRRLPLVATAPTVTRKKTA